MKPLMLLMTAALVTLGGCASVEDKPAPRATVSVEKEIVVPSRLLDAAEQVQVAVPVDGTGTSVLSADLSNIQSIGLLKIYAGVNADLIRAAAETGAKVNVWTSATEKE